MRNYLFAISLISSMACFSQTIDEFNEFRQGVLNNYAKERSDIQANFNSFRDKINAEYAAFLRNAWSEQNCNQPIRKPNIIPPNPPIVFEDNQINDKPVSVEPKIISSPKSTPAPSPVEPIKENTTVPFKTFELSFYGLKLGVRLPNTTFSISSIAGDDIADAWLRLSNGEYDNAVIDCIKIRDEHSLCDWAYINMLSTIAESYCNCNNEAALLTAWLLCQSGYQVRLAQNTSTLFVLFGCKNIIYNRSYFYLDGAQYYPLKSVNDKLRICNAKFNGEKPLSLAITVEQNLGDRSTEPRIIKSLRYHDIIVTSVVDKNLIDFYNTYPASAIGGNPLTNWAMYANTPISTKCANSIYPELNKTISGLPQLDAVNHLLNWVQTGFAYKYDEEVWGEERAFFAEETLFYPYCDCEDRAILFSKLVRDLVGLDVALVYYPNHLATAVKFTDSVLGDAINIDGVKYIICDPTYIGASAGHQMPKLDTSQVRAIVLNR